MSKYKEISFIEKTHEGGVISRTAPNAYVEEPVIVTVEGQSTALMLKDANALATGLLAAIKIIEEHQVEVKKQEHSFCIGKPENGMSMMVQSKLGINPKRISLVPFISDLGCLQNISEEAGRSILDNWHIKFVMKVDGSDTAKQVAEALDLTNVTPKG
jgi:hypothetical protein